MLNNTNILLTGAIFAGLTVIIGAFGAHALRPMLEANDRVSAFETGVLYQLFHSLAILITGIISMHFSSGYITRAFWCFVIGILLFSGSLYGLATVQWAWLGPITPVGGVFFIGGWVMLAMGIAKGKS